MRTLVGAVVAASLVLAGCADETPDTGFSGLPSESPSASASPVEPSPSASAEAQIDVTTTPDEITPEWVTAVVNTLLAEYGEMTAEILATPVTDDPTLPEGFNERLEELFAGEYLERRTNALQDIAANRDNIRDELLPTEEFGGLRFEAERVQLAEVKCIIAVGRVSRELTIPGGGPLPELSAISLMRGSGRLSWVIQDELANINQDGDANPDEVMLNATLSDYAGALDHDCDPA